MEERLTATREDLYEIIAGKLPDWITPAQRQTMAGEILDGLVPHIDARLGRLGNSPPEPIDGETEEERLKRFDPTNLMVLKPEQLPKLFEVQFPELMARFEEFAGTLKEWRADHTDLRGGMIPIKDDDENNELSDLMRQLRDFAGGDGEVHTARKRCKLMLFNGIKALDGWFNELADPILSILGEPANRPPPGTMQFAQNLYVTEKIKREKAERERIAAEAAREAQRKADEARKAAEEEAARIAALQKAGASASDARDIAETMTDRAASEADTAAATAALIGQAAAAPVQDMARSRSALGTTTTAVGTVDFEVVSIKDLCRAVAEDKAPITFVMIDGSAVRQAIRRKQNPIRECPGLKIDVTYAARRSGAR